MSDTIMGVLIGGVLGIVGSVIAYIVQTKLERSKEKREKRISAYIEVLDWTQILLPEDCNYWHDLTIPYNKIKMKVFIYGSKTVYRLFCKLEGNRKPMKSEISVEILIEIKKEIGI